MSITQQLFQIKNNEYYTEPNAYGELYLENIEWVIYNSDVELYDWQIEKYELQARYYWTIEAIPKKNIKQCYFVTSNPNIFERKIREHPTLAPMKN